MMMNMAEILFGPNPARVVKAPKWLAEMRINPVLRGDELWWECPPFLMVRGGPPSGVAFFQTALEILPANFGPVGRPAQVIPGEKDVFGIIALRDQLGEVRARCTLRHLRLAEAMAGRTLKWFVYPPRDPDTDQRTALVGFLREQDVAGDWDGKGEPTMIDRFTPFAFVSQVAVAMSNFVSQEAIDGLPTFVGTKGGGGNAE